MDSTTPVTTKSWSARQAALLILLVAIVLAAVFDFWYRGVLISRERERVLAYASPYAGAMESAVGRRLSRLAGLRTFVETRPSPKAVADEFPTFAAGLRVGPRGIRALELVRNGRITAVVPLDSNRSVLNYDLYGDSRPLIPGDVRRAIETGTVTITGPVELLQGGQGLVVRQRVVRSDTGFPDLVAMVIDLPALVEEAASFSRPATLATVVLDRKQDILAGTGSAVADPVILPIRVSDGGWSLHAAPREGWNAAVAGDLRPTRIASAVIALLLAWLGYVVAGNQQRLRIAVETNTQGLRSANEALVAQVREREVAEQRLRAQDERLRLALVSGQMGTWDYQPDIDRLLLSSGALAILGTPTAPSETTGAAFRDWLMPEAREVLLASYKQAQSTGEYRAEFRITQANADDRWLYWAGETQRDGQESSRLLGVVMDVTERHRLEEQLLHSQKMEAVGTLAGGIAHDFNNLLTAILGFARLSLQQAGTIGTASASDPLRPELGDLRTDLEEIVKAGERASLLTAQLLAFSRRQVTKPSRIDLSAAVHDVERMLQRLIGERIVLQTLCTDVPLYVRADAGQLAQVIVNLVVNARDAMPNGGRIRVTTELLHIGETPDPQFNGLPAGRWSVLSVRDEGIGMSPEVMSRMFEPFFTTKRVGEGTGLGLSTVYGIVTQSGGQAFVDSAPGAGTTVRVALPWDAQPERSTRTPLSNLAVSADHKTVLVVEDEPGLRRLVAEILSRRGFTVSVARDGQDALSLLDSGVVPDLVLTDVVMPRMGGPALLNELRRRSLDVPVLFMSGYPAGEEMGQEDSQALIDKPFTPDALVAKVREVLSSSVVT